MKKIAALIIALGMTLSISVSSASAYSYEDLSGEDAWIVNVISSLGIMWGCG